ncbi:SWIM zinc finger family protein [Kitasatospora nipponensis]
MEERWSTEHILSLAPDAASQKAAGKLSSPAPWSQTGSGQGALWGQCRGSGSTPYRTVVELATPAYQCSCPSRKFPCKHALGLLLLWSTGPQAVAEGAEPASWAGEWLAGRRLRAEEAAERVTARATAVAADPAAARRRAERRSARVAAGTQELRLRLTDRIRRGLADGSATTTDWEEVAARMVDAQAPGLASLVRELAQQPADALADHALLHLLAAAYDRVGELPAPLAATVRSRIGFTTDSAELLAGPTVRDRWLVLGGRDSTDERLTTRRLWLHGTKTARPALLLSFGRPGQAPELAIPTGQLLEAEVAFQPAARPLRAALGPRHGLPTTPSGPAARPPGLSPAGALAAYGEAVADDPWLTSWPVVLTAVVPVAGPTGWQLSDGREALDLRPAGDAALWRLVAVCGGRPMTVFGECGHRGFAPVTVWDESGRPTGVAQ